MALLSEYSLWFVILCILLGAAYSTILYYKNRNIDFGKYPKMVMMILRGLVIAMIAFLILSPMIKITVKEVNKPLLLFAVDNSESIILPENQDVGKIEKSLIDLQKALEKDYEVVTCLLGEQNDFHPFDENVDRIDFSGKSTNLSAVFDDISNLYRSRSVDAMVLLTDGIYNKGANPLYKAERVKYPIYAVGVGNTNQQQDIFISGINHNRQTYKGNYFPVEVKIAAHKLSGQSTLLTVSEKGEELYSKEIQITNNQFFETVKFSIEAKEKGMHRYDVTLSSVNEESNEKNNNTTFFVEVIDSREKIAVVYHGVHPDISAIRQTLDAIDKYEVEVFSVQEFNEKPGNYSLLILHQLPSLQHPISSLMEEILKEKVSTLFILGSQTNIPRFNALNTGLQIQQTRDLFNSVTPGYNDNFTSFTFSEESRQMIRKFPPLRTAFGDYKMSVSSNVFMYQQINGVATQYPLIMFNDVNGVKMGVITGDGLWQWRLYNHLYGNDHRTFDEVISKIVQLLSVKSDRSHFRVLGSQLHDESSSVEFTAELYNDSYELINEPDVVMTYRTESGTEYESRFSKQYNGYSLSLGRLPVGNYTWSAKVTNGGKQYVQTGSFIVKEVLLEGVNLVADHDLLRNMAQVSNGDFYTADQMEEIENTIRSNENIKSVVSYAKKYGLMLNSWWYFVIICILFGVEWFMRKWGGGY